MNRIQKVLSSVALASLLAAAPLFASAQPLSAHAGTGVFISQSGIVHVIGANVTSVGSGFVNAMTTLGNVVLNFIVNASADTKIGANGSAHASTTDIKVGDTVSFVGSLSSSPGSTLTVAAKKIRDITTFPALRLGAGTITSVNAGAGSFVMTKGDRTITVQTTASTTIFVNGAASTLASFKVGDKVGVAGSGNADGTVITASKVVVRNAEAKKSDTDNDHEKSKKGKGVHEGLRLFGGIHIGKDN